MVLSLGSGAAAGYFVARKDLTPRPSLEVGFSLPVLAAVVAALGVLLTYVLFDDRLADADVPYWLAALAVPAAVQFRSVEAVLQAQGGFAAFNAMGLSLGLTALTALAAVGVAGGLRGLRGVGVGGFGVVPPR